MHTHSARRIYAGDPGAQRVGGFPRSDGVGCLSPDPLSLAACRTSEETETRETAVTTTAVHSKNVALHKRDEIHQVEVQIESKRDVSRQRMEKS